jgi:hypothetical protein
MIHLKFVDGLQSINFIGALMYDFIDISEGPATQEFHQLKVLQFCF